MTNNHSLQLPKELEHHRTAIEKTIQPVITVNTIERSTSLYESKFEGNPYFPLSMQCT